MGVNGLERFSYFKKKFKPERSKNRFLSILFFILVFIFLANLIYFFIFRLQFPQKEKSVELKIEMPEKVVIGENFKWRILIKNNENSDLINAELFINFPQESFYLKNIDPSCQKNFPTGCLINIQRIKKDEQKEINIEGKIFGQDQEKKSFSVLLNFQLANFSSWFKKEVLNEIVLENYPFELEVFNPPELIKGEEGEFRVIVRNKGEEKPETKIVLIFPQDFQFSFSDPEFSFSENNEKSWLLNFEDNEEKIFNFKGFFTSSNEEEKKIKIIVGLTNQENFFPQLEKEFSLKLIQPGLVAGLRINNSFLEEQNADFGEKIDLNLNYKNVSQEKFFDLVIKLHFNHDEFLNLNQLSSLFWTWQSSEKKIESNQWKIESDETGKGKYLVWDKSQIKDLETIEPNEEGEIVLSLNLKSYEEVSKNKPINPSIDFSFLGEGNLFRHQLIVFKTESNQIKLKIKTRVKLEVEARYFDDQGLKIGDGPLPPKVNETTSYFIFLRPINTTNEIKNVKIETKLPEKITWLGEEKTSVGNIFFDNFSRKIIWQIDSIFPYAGGPYSFLEASFKIGLTPEEGDRGKVLTLLEKTTLEAEDSFTEAKIYLETPAIDSNLEFDDWAKGKGVVE